MGSAEFMTNEWIDDAGNAALAMNLAGQKSCRCLVDADTEVHGAAVADQPAAGRRLAAAGRPSPSLCSLIAAWRGRRLGPVTVRDSCRSPFGPRRPPRVERASTNATEHGTRRPITCEETGPTRCGCASGSPPTASDAAITQAVATSTGRRTEEVQQILYGPPPQADQDLVALGRQLSALEQEVRRA